MKRMLFVLCVAAARGRPRGRQLERAVATKRSSRSPESDQRFSTLVEPASSRPASRTPCRPGPTPVFAPTNEAFAQVPKASLDALAKNPDQLKAVADLPRRRGPPDGRAGRRRWSRITTVNGAAIRVRTRGGRVFLNGSTLVTKADLEGAHRRHPRDRPRPPPARGPERRQSAGRGEELAVSSSSATRRVDGRAAVRRERRQRALGVVPRGSSSAARSAPASRRRRRHAAAGRARGRAAAPRTARARRRDEHAAVGERLELGDAVVLAARRGHVHTRAAQQRAVLLAARSRPPSARPARPGTRSTPATTSSSPGAPRRRPRARARGRGPSSTGWRA